MPKADENAHEQPIGGPASTSQASSVGDERAEILRLIGKLRDNRRWREKGGAEALHDRLASVIESPGDGVAAARRRAPRVERRVDRDRMSKRKEELAEIKRLRIRLEARPPEVTKAVAQQRQHADVTVRSLEKRLASLEELVLSKGSGGAGASAALPPAGDLSSYTFSGIIQGDIMSDMLQLVSSNEMTGVYGVESDLGKIELFCQEGRIKHAAGQGLTGEGAFFAAFGFESGRYTFLETTDLPDEETITGNTQFLILEALRQIDEARASG